MPNTAKGVVIYDAEFQKAAQDIRDYGMQLNDMISKYVTGVEKITQTAIQSQRLSNKLSKLSERMVALQAPLNEIVDSVQKQCKEYIQAVDSADQFLY